jgi:hypothetical protein
MASPYGPRVHHDRPGRDGPGAMGAGSSSTPVGFLWLRLEPTAAGVRATVGWNLDVERRADDQQMRTLELDLVTSRVREFVDEYVAALPRS